MLQKTRSKSITKARYLIVLPVILAMLTIAACTEDKSTGVEEINKIEERTLFIQIEDFGNQTAEEKEKVANAIEGLKNSLGYDEVHIFDGKKTIIMSNDPETGKPQIVIENLHGGRTNKLIKLENPTSDVPFAVVEQVPLFPGCESLGTNEEQKKCMSEKVQEFVAKNFDTGLGKKLGLKGVNRVIAVFKISPEGKITEVRARAPHPDLEVEAKRVIEGLPNMTPGRNNGQNVGVSYSLPIVFQVNE